MSEDDLLRQIKDILDNMDHGVDHGLSREVRSLMERKSDLQFAKVDEDIAELKKIAKCAATRFDKLEEMIEERTSTRYIEEIARSLVISKVGGGILRNTGRIVFLTVGTAAVYYADYLKMVLKKVLPW